MANEKNLKPCKPGETHNPNGRPKGAKGVKATIKKYLQYELEHHNPLSGKAEKKPTLDHVILSAIAKALNGDDRAREDLLNRLIGKPVETTKMKVSGNLNNNDKTEMESLKSDLIEILKDEFKQ